MHALQSATTGLLAGASTCCRASAVHGGGTCSTLPLVSAVLTRRPVAMDGRARRPVCRPSAETVKPRPTRDRGAAAPGCALCTRGPTKAFGGRTVVRESLTRGAAGSRLWSPRAQATGRARRRRSGCSGPVNPAAGASNRLASRMPGRAQVALLRVGAPWRDRVSTLPVRADNLRRLDWLDATAAPAGPGCGSRGASTGSDFRPRLGRVPAVLLQDGSGGAAIAAALLVPRDLPILDELTDGLDPRHQGIVSAPRRRWARTG